MSNYQNRVTNSNQSNKSTNPSSQPPIYDNKFRTKGAKDTTNNSGKYTQQSGGTTNKVIQNLIGGSVKEYYNSANNNNNTNNYNSNNKIDKSPRSNSRSPSNSKTSLRNNYNTNNNKSNSNKYTNTNSNNSNSRYKSTKYSGNNYNNSNSKYNKYHKCMLSTIHSQSNPNNNSFNYKPYSYKQYVEKEKTPILMTGLGPNIVGNPEWKKAFKKNKKIKQYTNFVLSVNENLKQINSVLVKDRQQRVEDHKTKSTNRYKSHVYGNSLRNSYKMNLDISKISKSIGISGGYNSNTVNTIPNNNPTDNNVNNITSINRDYVSEYRSFLDLL